MNYKKAKKKWFKNTVYSWTIDTFCADKQLVAQIERMGMEEGFWLARKLDKQEYLGFRFTRKKVYK